jgi:hypothetical protein
MASEPPPPAAPPPAEPPPGPPTPPPLERLSLVSLLAAVCALIPVPWLDDLAERVVRRRAVGDLLRERGVDPTPGDVEVLAGLERPRRGCVDWLLWPLTGVALYVAKKLFRKVLFVLALGDAVRAASELFHDTYLLAHALGRGWLSPGTTGRIDRDEARWVRWAIESTVAETDPAPVRGAVRRALSGSGRLLGEEAVRMGGWMARERRQAGAGRGGGDGAVEERAAEDLPVAGEAARLSGLAGRLAAALGVEEVYRRRLEERLEVHLETARAARSQAAAADPSASDTLG